MLAWGGVALRNSVRRLLRPGDEVGGEQGPAGGQRSEGAQLQIIEWHGGRESGHQCQRFAAGQPREVDPFERARAPSSSDLRQRTRIVQVDGT